MTYFIKDCQQPASAAATTFDEIAAAVTKAFEPRPYIKGAFYVEPYADDDGDEPIELMVVPDHRFGTPHQPWAVTGCEEFADDLLASIGRDIDCYLDKCEHARHTVLERSLRPIYKRPDESIKKADNYLNSAMNSAMICAGGQNMPWDQADNIAFYAARTAGQSLLASIVAFGGRDIPTSTLPEILAEAERVGVVSHSDELAEIAARLEDGLAKREANEEVGIKQALRAVVDANRAADILHDARRPAQWVPVHDQHFLNTLRVTGLVPAEPKFKRGERVEFWRDDATHRGLNARRTGTVINIEDAAERLNYSKGSWWLYDIDCDEGIFRKEQPENELQPERCG